MTSSQTLSAMIEGLYRDKANADLPVGLKLAPPSSMRSARGEFLSFTSVNRFDDRKDGGKFGSFSQDYQKATVSLAPVPVILNEAKSSQYHIPEVYLASLLNSSAYVNDIMNMAADEIYGGFTNYLQAAISSAGLITGTALNLSTGSADIVDAINDTLTAINLASGKEANTIYMSRATFNAMMNQDQLQEGSAISGFTSAGSAVRRLGSIAPEAVYSFFKSRFNLDLLVDTRVITNSSGAAAYAAGNNITIAHVGQGTANSCFKTFHLGTYTPSTLIDFDVREAAGTQARGQLVAGTAAYGIVCLDPSLGATCSVTL